MNTIDWWPKLEADARAWLIEHNGEVVAGDVVIKIAAAGGAVTSNAWWIGGRNPEGIYLSDEAVDWIEATANGE